MHVSKLLITGTALIACTLSTPALAQSNCELVSPQHTLQSCTSVGQELRFDMRVARGYAQPGDNDPLWQVQGSAAQVVTINSAWNTNGGRFQWVSPTTTHTNSTVVYSANVNIPEDPYFYDNLVLKISVGADNSVRRVRVNGVDVNAFTGALDNLDFKQGNFEFIAEYAGNDGGPFKQGCNKIEIDVYNQSGPTGLTVRGALTAKCTKCTTPKPGT